MQAVCPYCGERIELTVDRAMLNDPYSEDCPVCCRPMNITARASETENLILEVGREDT